ncbi:hypothetical protein AVEN_27740-1 [Araneus ventricosus]|uniref:Uncharacterized protein n=1 Tax=Araneus ventricosus TaxID=182803 RepID=A0A4Y2LNL7_ARAVE|nr:hypothetical protein AVEN_27740-1 [Araneus ventricosus]
MFIPFFSVSEFIIPSAFSEYLEKNEIESLRKRLAEVETDEDPDFDNGPGDVSEESFSDDESFCEHDTELEEDGDAGNEDVNNLELLSSKEGIG